MIATILSAIAGAAAFATSVALHSKIAETPNASLGLRLSFDAAGALALTNAAALLVSYPNGSEQIVGAGVFAGVAAVTLYFVSRESACR